MNKKRMDRGISRVKWQTEKGVAQGWQVRVQRRGVIRRRFFNDKKYGGKKKAMAMARVYRERAKAELLFPPPGKLGSKRPVTDSGESMGIHRVASRCRKDSGVYRYEYWQVLWSPKPGERRCRRFSIHKYGEKGAYELAVTARQKAIQKRPGTRFY